MKEKLLAQLIIKYPGVSKKFLGLFAEKLTPKVTEESQIEGVVDELENLPISVQDLATEWQKEGDARVNVAKQEWVKNPPKPDKPTKTDPPPTDPPKDDEPPTWAKTLIEQNKTLSDKIQEIEKGKVYETVKQKLAQHLKDVPASIWSKRVLPENEEAIENFVTEVQNDYKTDFVEKGLLHTNSGSGRASYSTNGKATVEETKGIVDKILPKQ